MQIYFFYCKLLAYGFFVFKIQIKFQHNGAKET